MHYKKDGGRFKEIPIVHLGLLLIVLLFSFSIVIIPIITFTSKQRVVQAVPEYYDLSRLRTFQALLQSTSGFIHVVFTPSERRDFLFHHGKMCNDKHSNYSILDTYDKLGRLAEQLDTIEEKFHIEYLQLELWKFCVLGSGYATAFVDFDMVDLLQSFEHIFPEKKKNYLIRSCDNDVRSDKIDLKNGRDTSLVHTALLVLRLSSGRKVARSMVEWIIDTVNNMIMDLNDKGRINVFTFDIPFKQSEKLFILASESTAMYPKDWEWFEKVCSVKEKNSAPNSDSDLLTVSPNYFTLFKGYCSRDSRSPCCEVKKKANQAGGIDAEIVVLLQHPIAPKRVAMVNEYGKIQLPYVQHELLGTGRDFRKSPLQNYQISSQEAMFMSIVRDVKVPPSEFLLSKDERLSPSFFDLLSDNDCLPNSDRCLACLQKLPVDDPTKQCEQCKTFCGCYCRVLCQIRPKEKRIKKEVHVFPPLMKRNEDRLIPRIIHQTWFEDVEKDKYPRMSKMANSWKKSGWEYSFYADNDSMEFLSMHFPKEVRLAYESILPGAFKADLFRYCVLFIRGGVYADMDVLLSADLDVAIPGNIGLMTGIDEPGIEFGHRYCLWNGFIAAAPGHPIIAKTIEMVVNNIRNRFTSADIDDMLCPNPVLSVAHAFDLLHVSGPCIFGAAFNSVLGKHMQSNIPVGEIDIWEQEKNSKINATRVTISPDDQRFLISGRTIVLSQNKEDMGSHRFTFLEKNIIVVSTDLPDSKDQTPVRKGDKERKHYSSYRNYRRLYGVQGLYQDDKSADEQLRFVVRQNE